MEINTDYTPAAADTAVAAESAPKSDRPVKLAEGDVIKGEITDIQKNQVTVRTDSGETVTARLAAPIDAKIGQEQAFTVKIDENGNPILEMKALPKEAMQKNAISDVLTSFGIKPTEDNMKLATVLLSHQLPLTKDMLQKLNQALKLMGSEITPQTIEKALFLIDNKMSINPKTVETLTGFANGQIKLADQLTALMNQVGTMPPSPLKNNLLNALTNGEAALGDETIIRNVVEQLKQSPIGLEAKITQAFAKQTISQTGFQQLGESLTLEFPQQKELIASLMADKNNFVELVEQNKPELLHKITQLMQENKPTPETFTALVQSLKEQATPNEIKFLIHRLFSEGDPIGAKILDMLQLSPKLSEPTHANLFAGLSFGLEKADPKEIDFFLNQLKNNIASAKTLLTKTETLETAKILDTLGKVNQNLEFVAQVKNNLFAQLPIAVSGQETNAELFVFRDKKHRKNTAGKMSALIALDTLNLGRFEVYVQKEGKQVICQFRLQDEGVEKLVRIHMPKLQALLEQHEYQLNNCTFKQLTDAFTVLDNEDRLGDETLKQTLGRISFDIRT